MCVQRTTFQLVHCRHFENGGKVVCVSADQFAGASLTAKKNSKDGRGERGHLLEPAIKKEKAIMLGSGELSSQVVWNKLLWVLS